MFCSIFRKRAEEERLREEEEERKRLEEERRKKEEEGGEGGEEEEEEGRDHLGHVVSQWERGCLMTEPGGWVIGVGMGIVRQLFQTGPIGIVHRKKSSLY